MIITIALVAAAAFVVGKLHERAKWNTNYDVRVKKKDRK